MAKIKHDADGFLTGESVDMGRIQAVWDEMHDDLREIRRVLTQHGVVGRGVAPALARRAGAAGDGAAPTIDESYVAMRATQQAIRRAAAKPAVRDARGRFVGAKKNDAPKAPGAGGGDAGGGGGGGEGGEEGRMRAFADRLVGAVKESGSGIEEADPAVKAFNEVARPLARGYEMIGGGKEKRQEGLLRRIYSTLTGFRKEETGFSKATNKTLKSIDGKAPTAPGGAASNGMFGGLMSKLPSVGGLISGAGGGLLSMERGLAGAGKGLLRRVPLLGTLLAGASAVSDIFNTETDDSLTRREKDGRDGKAAGGFAGSVGGMLAGAKLGAAVGTLAGPIGTAIGGVVGGAAGMFFGDQAGQIMGEKVGGWVSDLREADIPGKITAAWDTTTDYMKKGWSGALDRISEGWAGLQKAGKNVADWAEGKLDSANSFVRDATGVDVKAGISGAKAKAVELGGQAVDGIKAGAQWTAENTTVGRGVAKVATGAQIIGGKIADRWNDAKQYLLGASDKAGVDAGTVAKIANFESGFNADATPTRRDGTKISSAHGYGQFLDGTWTGMVNKYGAKYGIEGAGNLTKDQAAKYRNDKTIQAGMLAEFTRENVEKGRRFGGTDDDANVYAFHNLGDKDAKSLLTGMQDPSMSVRDALLRGSTSEKERARIEAVISGNKSLYGDGSVTAAEAYSRMGKMMQRGDAFAADARQAQGVAVAQGAGPQVPGIAVPSVPAVASTNVAPVSVAPAVPAVAEAPQVAVPLASNGSDRPVQVAMKAPDAGQDLRERGIAHVATGGLGG